jgi:hypothetical protein
LGRAAAASLIIFARLSRLGDGRNFFGFKTVILFVIRGSALTRQLRGFFLRRNFAALAGDSTFVTLCSSSQFTGVQLQPRRFKTPLTNTQIQPTFRSVFQFAQRLQGHRRQVMMTIIITH